MTHVLRPNACFSWRENRLLVDLLVLSSREWLCSFLLTLEILSKKMILYGVEKTNKLSIVFRLSISLDKAFNRTTQPYIIFRCFTWY
jgi:hypothetical protein